MKKITEAMIQRAVLDYLGWLSKSKSLYAFRSGAGHLKTEGGNYFKTGKPGCPDITLCLQCSTRSDIIVGTFVALEIKSATGRQSALQKQAEKEITKAGGFYYLIRSISDAKEAIQKTIETMRNMW